MALIEDWISSLQQVLGKEELLVSSVRRDTPETKKFSCEICPQPTQYPFGITLPCKLLTSLCLVENVAF